MLLVVYSSVVSVLLVLMTCLAFMLAQYYTSSLILLSAIRSSSREAQAFIDGIAEGPPKEFFIEPELRAYAKNLVSIAKELQSRPLENHQERRPFSQAELN